MTRVKLCLVTFGVIVGTVGVLHGSAELLKGATPVESHFVEALPEGWPNSVFHSLTEGSPVFTILTDIPFFVLGILAISVSTVLIVCSATVFRSRGLRTGSLLLAVLSAGVFLFGAGTGTPLFVSAPVVVTGLLATRSTERSKKTKASGRRTLYGFWSFYWLHIFSWVLFFPGLFVFSFYADIPPALFLFAFLSMPVGALGALAFGYTYDRTTPA